MHQKERCLGHYIRDRPVGGGKEDSQNRKVYNKELSQKESSSRLESEQWGKQWAFRVER